MASRICLNILMLFFLLSLSFDNPLARLSVQSAGDNINTTGYGGGGGGDHGSGSGYGSAPREDTDVCPHTNSLCQMGQ
ncbi:hypothetical protein ZOSMA_91G00720 [Zostera marina]|uniref:Glycine-rich protein n=1 Tax=Zostera marina TaxID=29655 RepID=A0A0K9NJ57_ZOSMR|nr:hypothetical protein ZOSMA_91G00720 [Zostera marina]